MMRYTVKDGTGAVINTIVCEPDFAPEYERLTGYTLEVFPEDIPPYEPTETEALGQQITDAHLANLELGQQITDLQLQMLGGQTHV